MAGESAAEFLAYVNARTPPPPGHRWKGENWINLQLETLQGERVLLPAERQAIAERKAKEAATIHVEAVMPRPGSTILRNGSMMHTRQPGEPKSVSRGYAPAFASPEPSQRLPLIPPAPPQRFLPHLGAVPVVSAPEAPSVDTEEFDEDDELEEDE